MNTKLTKIISGLFVATAAFQTASAGNITDIKVSSLPNKQKIVKVSFDKEIVNPTGFVTSSPARIALDFEQTGISMDQQVLEYADPLLSKISAAQNSSRARLVLNLNKPGQYNTEVRGNKVWIFINESDDTVSAPARPAVKAAPAAPGKTTGCRTVYQVRSIRIQTLYPGKTTGCRTVYRVRSIRIRTVQPGKTTGGGISKTTDGSTSKTTGGNTSKTNQYRFPQRRQKCRHYRIGCIGLCRAARHQPTARPHHRYAEKPYPADHAPTQFGCGRL